ncbi:hypothetical protein [Methanobrevibacter sp.]|uniref:hypothetical protein n=1 Tax=Methanobrevibacter sp. TaxID=66852 RepID=UPI00386F6EDA
MTVIETEIIDYIENSDFDENIKKFLMWAIIDEIRNPNKSRYTQSYENQMEKILGID